MDATVLAALAADRVIDITTIGRKSGEPRRIETWYHRVDGKIYLSGWPGKRDWIANLEEHPDFTFHLKRSVVADLPATATIITDDAERRRIFRSIVSGADYEAWVAGSPLVEVTFVGQTMNGPPPVGDGPSSSSTRRCTRAAEAAARHRY